MPQIGQVPGPIRRTSGCIGQVYSTLADTGAGCFAGAAPARNRAGSERKRSRQRALQK